LATIDTRMLGEPGITGAFLVRGERSALVETGPMSTLDAVLEGLRTAGIDDLDLIVVTHIHLDHAGAAGSLARRFPRATVVVHELGAPHLVDPSKLWSSAARIYGDAMESMWGGIEPLAPERIRAIGDGAVVDLGGGRRLRAVATPGHAAHHHAFLDEDDGRVFAGDALGVRLPDMGVLRPATPPPEFDLEAARASIARIRALRPTAVVLTHFGDSREGEDPLGPEEMCDGADRALVRWTGWVREAHARTEDVDEAAAAVARAARDDLEATLSDAQIARLERTTTYRMNTWGMMRYLRKRAEAPA
jgi:glyoxylase-like metal-dependent hydrolase (beta-lactamase superfamily II)